MREDGPVLAANGPVKTASAGGSAFVAVRAEHLAVEPLLAGGDVPEGTLAAELCESWMFTPDAAAAIAADGGYSTVKGAVAPQGLPPLSSIPLRPTIPLDQIVKADNAAITSAKQYWGG
ncbi:MAG TPA: hypothetical protein VF223_14190 [Trebonia sp.]